MLFWTNAQQGLVHHETLHIIVTQNAVLGCCSTMMKPPLPPPLYFLAHAQRVVRAGNR